MQSYSIGKYSSLSLAVAGGACMKLELDQSVPNHCTSDTSEYFEDDATCWLLT